VEPRFYQSELLGAVASIGTEQGVQMDVTLGERFVDALTKKDARTLKSLLSHDVDFKALTPGKFWESNDVDEVVDDTLLG
jgi:hypothetical protein